MAIITAIWSGQNCFVPSSHKYTKQNSPLLTVLFSKPTYHGFDLAYWPVRSCLARSWYLADQIVGFEF